MASRPGKEDGEVDWDKLLEQAQRPSRRRSTARACAT